MKKILFLTMICNFSLYGQENNIIARLVELDKTEIITGQPIWLKVKVTNNSKFKIVLDYDYIETSIIVTDSNGKVWKRNLKGFRILVPTFLPGLSANYEYELNEKYGTINSKTWFSHLTPGNYQVQLVFKPMTNPDQQSGEKVLLKTVKSNVIYFKVKNPGINEADSFAILNSAMRHLFDQPHRDQLKSMDQFNRLIDQYPNSVYHEKAIMMAGLVYRHSRKDSLVNKTLSKYKQALELYPDTRYYKYYLGEIVNISRRGINRSIPISVLDKVEKNHNDPRAREYAAMQIKWIKSAPDDEWNHKLKAEKMKMEKNGKKKKNDGN